MTAAAPQILHDEDGLIVVDKPAGLPSTGRNLDDPDCVQSWLMRHLRRRKIWAVHQLDRDTSGLNLFVRRKALVAQWSAQLASAQSEKRYLAICRGTWPHGEHTITLPIGPLPFKGGTRPGISHSGKAAHSDITPLAIGTDASLLEVRIRTGRTHQVRVHLAALGHPLLGERLHCEPPCTRHHRHALHAAVLRLPGLPELQAPLPADLETLRDGLGLRARYSKT